MLVGDAVDGESLCYCIDFVMFQSEHIGRSSFSAAVGRLWLNSSLHNVDAHVVLCSVVQLSFFYHFI